MSASARLTGEQVFLNIMRARHPEYRWRALSEDERREHREATGEMERESGVRVADSRDKDEGGNDG